MKRNYIVEQLKKNVISKVGKEILLDNFTDVLTTDILLFMLKEYDHYFLKNTLLDFLKRMGCTVTVCFENRCSKTAGKCWLNHRDRCYTVKLSSKVFKNAIKSDTDVRDNNGILCTGVFECIMVTFEHEIIHALIGCFCKDDAYHNRGPGIWQGAKNAKNGHSKTFMAIVNNLFGHTEFRHNLFKIQKLKYFTNLTKDQIKILKSAIKDSIIEAYYDGQIYYLKVLK